MSGAGAAPGQRTDGGENMYLALLPTAESERLIRHAAPEAGELHLTVIHSPERSIDPPAITTDAWWAEKKYRTLTALVGGVGRFGPPHKPVLALPLAFQGFGAHDLADLIALRAVAEVALTGAGIPWSKQWQFRPHVSLGPANVVKVVGVLPRELHFDRLEWRR